MSMRTLSGGRGAGDTVSRIHKMNTTVSMEFEDALASRVLSNSLFTNYPTNRRYTMSITDIRSGFIAVGAPRQLNVEDPISNNKFRL
jgi:hypothetical protein